MTQAREMAHLTKELSHASKFRTAAVDSMREATKSTLAECAEIRGEMAREYRAQAQKFLSALTRDVASHRKAMAHQVAQTQKVLGAKAKDVAAHRNATMNQIVRFGNARVKATSRLRDRLEQQVDAMIAQTAEAVTEMANAHGHMAKQQKARLKSGRHKLHKDSAAFLKSTHADRMKAQGIWSSFKLGGAA